MKTKYRPDFPERAFQYSRLGLNGKQLAKKLGICEDTLYQYIKKYPEFAEAIEKGKEKPDFEVVNACYRLACGYEHTMTQQKVMMVDGKPTVVEYEQTIYVQPNQQSIQFWLTNRKKEYFKAVAQLTKEIEASGAGDEDLSKIAEAIRESDMGGK